MAMAVTVPVVNGEVLMDGHRPDNDFYTGLVGPVPIAQLRVTQGDNVIELALTRGQINDIYDMMNLYR